MHKTTLAATLLVLFAVPAFAQSETEDRSNEVQQMQDNAGTDNSSSGMMNHLSILPQGCRDAVQSATSGTMQGGMGMSGMRRVWTRPSGPTWTP